MREIYPPSIIVGVGAAFGAALRFLLGLQFDAFTTMFFTNALGCLAMGYWRPALFWGTGFLGGFTSFSSFIIVVGLLSQPLWLIVCAVLILGPIFIACYAFGEWVRQHYFPDARWESAA
ncbi:MAG: CrcB family protein [Corynebacterium sp.]|nr:CrcB family protein [Corynebacterium sp.]